MKFYLLDYESGENVGKTFPQSQEIVSNISINESNHLLKNQGKSTDDVYIPDFLLHSKAKVTDLISSSICIYPIISNKLKNILENFINSNTEFLSMNLIVKQEKLKYWILNIFKSNFRYIDFEKSTFEKINGLNNSLINIYPKSDFEFIEMINNKKAFEGICIKRLFLKEGIEDQIFLMNRFNGNSYFISENLKKQIEAAKCTGIKFIEFNTG